MDREERKRALLKARNEALSELRLRHLDEFNALLSESYARNGLEVKRRGLLSDEERRARRKERDRLKQIRRTERARAARLAGNKGS